MGLGGFLNDRLSGSLVGLKVDGVYVACEISCDFRYSVDMKPSSSTQSGGYREFIPGKFEWTMSVNAKTLLSSAGTSFVSILQGAMTGHRFELEFRPKLGGDVPPFSFKGYAYANGGGMTGQRGQTSTWDHTFQGSGLLNMTVNEFWRIINAMPANADKPVYIDTTQW